jgi:hypothetical protein
MERNVDVDGARFVRVEYDEGDLLPDSAWLGKGSPARSRCLVVRRCTVVAEVAPD